MDSEHTLVETSTEEQLHSNASAAHNPSTHAPENNPAGQLPHSDSDPEIATSLVVETAPVCPEQVEQDVQSTEDPSTILPVESTHSVAPALLAVENADITLASSEMPAVAVLTDASSPPRQHPVEQPSTREEGTAIVPAVESSENPDEPKDTPVASTSINGDDAAAEPYAAVVTESHAAAPNVVGTFRLFSNIIDITSELHAALSAPEDSNADDVDSDEDLCRAPPPLPRCAHSHCRQFDSFSDLLNYCLTCNDCSKKCMIGVNSLS